MIPTASNEKGAFDISRMEIRKKKLVPYSRKPATQFSPPQSMGTKKSPHQSMGTKKSPPQSVWIKKNPPLWSVREFLR
jgi:hypothetical protein